MKTNIRTPISAVMLETLPKGYSIYGNGCNDFAKLVARAGSPEIIRWLGGMLKSWCIPTELVGDNGDCIYAVPVGSVLYSLLWEDETQNEEPMTIAQMLGITEFPFEIHDKKGNLRYFENADGFWRTHQYDSNGRLNFYESSYGDWWKYEFDADGNETYYEDSGKYWRKYEYDANGRVIYFENSGGYWRRHEYNSRGIETYYENSLGTKRGHPSKIIIDGVTYQKSE